VRVAGALLLAASAQATTGDLFDLALEKLVNSKVSIGTRYAVPLLESTTSTYIIER